MNYLPNDITYKEMCKKVAIIEITRLTKEIYKKYQDVSIAKEMMTMANSMRHLTDEDEKISDENDRYIRIMLFKLHIKYYKLKCALADSDEDCEYYAFSLFENQIEKYFLFYVK